MSTPRRKPGRSMVLAKVWLWVLFGGLVGGFVVCCYMDPWVLLIPVVIGFWVVTVAAIVRVGEG